MYSDISFCLTNSLKPNNFQLTIIYDKEKHHMFAFKELEEKNVWDFCLKND